MFCAIKFSSTLRSLTQKKNILLNAIVISQVHYSALFFVGVLKHSNNSNFGKEMQWKSKPVLVG